MPCCGVLCRVDCDLTPCRPQLKLRSQIALEQERLLTEAADERQRLQQQLKEATDRQTASAADTDRLQAEIAELRLKLDAAHKLGKTNENGESLTPVSVAERNVFGEEGQKVEGLTSSESGDSSGSSTSSP